MGIYKKLQAIQLELKAPKNQYNEFGKFYYRNGEDILEAVKPLCQKHGAVLKVSDTVIEVGGRHYVKATVSIHDAEDSSEVIHTEAYAREAESKSGMDASQITGLASSYARKYALNGLFCIDDVKDADFHDNRKKDEQKTEKVTSKQIAELQALAKRKGVEIGKIANGYKLRFINDISPAQYKQAMDSLKKREDAR